VTAVLVVAVPRWCLPRLAVSASAHRSLAPLTHDKEAPAPDLSGAGVPMFGRRNGSPGKSRIMAVLGGPPRRVHSTPR
jgi:hypothetical protein